MLAKTHPYNPLWAQLGDLYGAIGSPVRLTRTVVVGKQKDLVQRILYVLTYFLRCSELQENQLTWTGKHREGDQVISGSKLVTALEKGEVEESEYVVVSVRNDPALVPPVLPSMMAKRRGPGPPRSASTPDGIDMRYLAPTPDREGSRRSQQCTEACSTGFPGPAPDSVWTPHGAFHGGRDSEEAVPPAGFSGPPCCEVPGAGKKIDPQTVQEEMKEEMPKKLREPSAAQPCPDRHSREEPPAEKVTFHIGGSVSPESDFESRTKSMDERLRGCAQRLAAAGTSEASAATSEAWDGRASGCISRADFQRGTSSPCSAWENSEPSRGCAEDRGASGQLLQASSRLAPPCLATGVRVKRLEKTQALHQRGARGPVQLPALDSYAPQDTDVPHGDANREASFRVEGDLPRNESSDSALGDSGDEASAFAMLGPGPGSHGTEGSLEVELPLPRSESISNPHIRNFGRSLLAGYCPAYMPDLVLHGTSSDEKLRQCLLADLIHTVHHPVLDEPIAEAVCIVADTDKWSVQVATSQRKVTDGVRLGQDVLVSSQVSSLLQSILQLYKLHLPADFCIMHLEDRLQELYLKSKMLSEYLRGHTRVHVKELGLVLGIESNDLPLLTAVASTHSPHVAQILL